MQNGMVKNNLYYKNIESFPVSKIFKDLLQLYVQIFEDADISFFETRFKSEFKSLSLLAYSEQKLMGLK